MDLKSAAAFQQLQTIYQLAYAPERSKGLNSDSGIPNAPTQSLTETHIH